MSRQDVDQHLDTVRSVLDEHLEFDQARRAFDLWLEIGGAHQPGALVSFVKMLGHEFDIPPHRRHALRSALYRAQNGMRLPTPKQRLVPSDAGGMEFLVFIALTDYLIDALYKRGGVVFADFQAAAHDSLNSLPLERYMQNNLRDWLNRRGALDTTVMEVGQLRGLLNALYVALCESLGPSPADALLKEAVLSVEQMSIAENFSPRSFL